MDIQDLDLEAALRAPDWVKAVVLLVVVALIGSAFWWFVYAPHQEAVQRMEDRVASLKARYQRKKRQVANLPALREQYQQLEKRMGRALEQLPDRSEVASLLVEVTRAGRSEGLSFELFRPAEEKPQDFYAVLPVEVEVRGSYNAMGRFLAATASLPRIVNIGDIQLSGGEGGELTMKGQARTFRYLGEEEQ
ncbi:type 4a pilus biogenesis protein PilO [Thiohalorhabdus methylotrophus]|uniref:Type 4a pilus biogenesis protein PilO n=1 Tax=Thiohalorhabdus methylotrophus TaxID=3242694 RepID=A0ABV4TPW2_9GAMM